MNLNENTIKKSVQLPKAMEFPNQCLVVQRKQFFVLEEDEGKPLIGNQGGWKLM